MARRKVEDEVGIFWSCLVGKYVAQKCICGDS